MGVTNNVQPYCRLAIITMQMMPRSSWTQRSFFRRSRAASADETDALVVMSVLLSNNECWRRPIRCSFAAARRRGIPLIGVHFVVRRDEGQAARRSAIIAAAVVAAAVVATPRKSRAPDRK